MDIIPVLIDSRPTCLAGASLLAAPIGAGTLYALVREALQTLRRAPLIISNEPMGDEYLASLRRAAPDAAIHHVRDLAGLIETYEPSDCLLLVNPSVIAAADDCFEPLLDRQVDHRLANHIVLPDAHTSHALERVVLDSENQVTRIDRVYPGVTDIRTRDVLASLVPIHALRGLSWSERPLTLPGLRAELVTYGLPSRDIPVSHAAPRLSTADGLLHLNEQVLAHGGNDPPEGFRELNENILVDADVSIHPTARLHGPLVLHRGVTVQEDAVLFGPAVLCAGAEVGRDALVGHSVVLPGMKVPPHSATLYQVGLADAHGAEQASTEIELPLLRRGRAAQQRPSARSAGLYPALKRVVDFSVALVGLALLLPLMLVVAVVIKLTSRGPVFFGHGREGRGGRVFCCWKFRTMVDGAHQMQRQLYDVSHVDGPQFKIAADPRVTTLGKILRASNIDELPQLFNVLRGEMSLIGPRPSPFRENQICVPWREARLSVRPGITGLWQICRHDRDAGDFHQWIYYDTLYVRHLSFAADVKILLATVLTLGGRFSVPLRFIISAKRTRESETPLQLPIEEVVRQIESQEPQRPATGDRRGAAPAARPSNPLIAARGA
ncbi:UDP-N-acetylgalactosamine-undecaprenyl-phosphate N-acetylgalactosaminephosphotransferase [Phycisphaerae bacterium RAS1]|nr:UDP-N-acetylgalactosamine-undecaprenyl-phosphate N-acetylgalactosaminephosphotransferase [Phycisphaerae bacterium RAS1]